jgi:hypothetical protein
LTNQKVFVALPTPKELKQLAAACRAAGIKQFKGEGIEFTLSDSEPPAPKPRGRAAKAKVIENDTQEPDTKESTPTEQELLYWSAGGGVPIPMNPDGNS